MRRRPGEASPREPWPRHRRRSRAAGRAPRAARRRGRCGGRGDRDWGLGQRKRRDARIIQAHGGFALRASWFLPTDLRAGSKSASGTDAYIHMDVRLKRAYEPAAPADGYRLLIDRLWPRGLSRRRVKLDDWDKQLAPSTSLSSGSATSPAASTSSAAATSRNFEVSVRASRDSGGARGRHADARLLGPRRQAQRRGRPR